MSVSDSLHMDNNSNKVQKLCLDCQKRYQTNPLRILDCKICSLPQLPSYAETLKKNDVNYQKELINFLNQLEINHYYNEKLVRGLDYYTGMVFELLIDEQGKQTVVLGGGRYDQLFHQFKTRIGDGQSIGLPAAGFALGIDRLVDYFFSLHQQNSAKVLSNFSPFSPDIFFLILDLIICF